MKITWKTDGAELDSHASWVEHLEPKNRRQGTSAPTLATAWAGPVEVAAVVHARLPRDERLVVCLEAKAGEPLGETVGEYQKAANKKRSSGRPTKAPERIEGLLKRYVPHYAATEERVRLMRYQLLSALAGTESEAAESGADHAVLMMHEFRTDQRPDDPGQRGVLVRRSQGAGGNAGKALSRVGGYRPADRRTRTLISSCAR